MDGSSLWGFLQSKFAVVDRAIAEALQNQEVLLELASDEEIARHMQEMENLFINPIPDERSHFNRPIAVVPIQTEPLSRGSPNWNPLHEGNETNDFNTEYENNAPRGHDSVDSDNMSYEQLQELAEDIGSESKGLSEETIASLRVSKFKSGFFSNSKKRSDNCAICQSAIRKGEYLITLPCKHYFHKECIIPWLKMNKVCPMCKYEIDDN